MATNKTFHIPPADQALWDAAQRLADKRQTRLYRLVREALAEHLPRAAAEDDRWASIAPDAA